MIGVVIITCIAFVFGIILVYIDSKTRVSENEEYLKYLPGYNCGACGFGSCLGMADAMEENLMNYKKCKPLKADALKRMEVFIQNKEK